MRVRYVGMVEALDSLTLEHGGLQLVAALAMRDIGLKACIVEPSPDR